MKLARYFSLNGRTSRLGYWRLQIPLTLIAAVFWCGGFLLAEATGIEKLSALGLVAALPVFWAVIALLFRRLHDRNKSGWWIVPFNLVPLFLALVAATRLGQGADLTAGLAALAELALLLWAFIEVGLLSGTKGKNPFGADPRAA